MPWKEASAMSLRLEFILLAQQGDANIRALCRRFGISAPTAYKWIERHRRHGLGISLSHSRVCHPQTLGKDERFHRTLQYELVSRRTFTTLDDCQNHYDRWRTIYNCERPHEALQMAVPASRYHVSHREFPETLPPPEYGVNDLVRKVDPKGTISFRNHSFKIGKGFSGYNVALRPTTTDGLYDVFFCHQRIDHVDLTNKTPHNV